MTRYLRFLTSPITMIVCAVLLVWASALGLVDPTWLTVPVVFGTISFSSVPTTLRVPFVTAEFNNTRAQQGPALLPYRVLVIGQKTSGGAWTANTLNKATSVDAVIAGAGRGSMLHRMALAYFANNRFTETYFGVLADNGAGVQASGTLTVTGPATAAGTLHLYLGGNYVPVAVANGAVQNDIATAIAAAITAAADLPVTAIASTNVVTVTHRHKGATGNDFDMRLNYQDGESTPTGVAVAIVAMASGATPPSLTSLIAAMGDNWFQVVIHPYTDSTSLTALEAEMSSRFGPMRMIDGLLITSAAGTQSALGTLGDSRNSPHSIIVAQPGKNPLTPPSEFAAAVGAVVAYNAPNDPARPFQTLPLTGDSRHQVKPPAEIDRFTFTERNLELYDGISTTQVAAGGVVQLERMVTTYQTSSSGASDTSYLDATTMLTLLYLRYSWRNRIATKFPRHKLANDGTRFGAGQAVATPNIIRAECIAWFGQMEELGLVENLKQFKQDLVVERNISDPNRVDVLLPPDVINQLVVTAGRVDFRL